MKRIGLALGGGGARGVAHLGVWLRLKEPFGKLNIVDVLMGTLMIFNAEMTRRTFEEDKPDVIIRPDVGDIMVLDFRNAARLVDIGRAAVVDEIKTLLS